MKLIDADKLINSIQHELWDWESVDGIASSTVLKQTISDIKNEPIIDAVPVHIQITEHACQSRIL